MLQHVIKFIKKYSLLKTGLSVKVLKKIFRRLGYKTIYFNKFNISCKVQNIIDIYGLNKQASSHKVFIFSDASVKLLFMHENMGDNELIYYMLHELAHIHLNHINNIGDEDVQEWESNEFAVYVRLILRYRNIFSFSVVALLASIIMSITCFIYSTMTPTSIPKNNNIEVGVQTTATSIQQDSDETVYKITGGRKMHKADCVYIKNKTNIIEIPQNNAIAAGYEPCKVCKPY